MTHQTIAYKTEVMTCHYKNCHPPTENGYKHYKLNQIEPKQSGINKLLEMRRHIEVTGSSETPEFSNLILTIVKCMYVYMRS